MNDRLRKAFTIGTRSLVQAGIVAALRRQRWPGAPTGPAESAPADPWPHTLRDSRAWLFLTMKLGDRPLYALARAFAAQWTEPIDPARDRLAQEWEQTLRDGVGLRGLLHATIDQLAERVGGEPPRRFVLVVDQGEELYTRAAADQARRFSALLAEAADLPELVVLGSIRSDHYGCLQEDEPLFRTLARVDVPPLREAELYEVIARPPALLGARFEDDALVGQLATAAAGEPGALPLLSYLLEDLWTAMQTRGDGVLHAADYAERGELRGVLARRAEAYVQRCSPEQQRTLMRLFTLKLAHVPADGAVVRRRAHRDECSAAEWAMAQELAGPDWRLLVTGEEAGQPTVEVAHEILLRRWDRLAGPGGWLAAQRNFLYWRGRLEQDRKDWQTEADEGRKAGYLLRDLRLDRALGWLAQRGEDLAGADRAFIRASLTLREREHAARERRRRRITVASLAATVVMAALLVVALWTRNEAEQQRQAAVAANTQAQAQRDEALRTQSRFLADLSRQQTEAGDPTTGILLALAGLPSDTGKADRPYVADAERALYAAVLANREKCILRGHTDRVCVTTDNMAA